jgi:transcriptional regulator with XRE-family HTH domain
MPRTAEPIPFGPLLGQLRRRHGLSQEDLADQLGCKRTYISQLERNLKIPSTVHLQRLAHALTLASHEAEALVEAASISRDTLELPSTMPLKVRQQLVRLIRHGNLTSLGSWSALEQALATIVPVSR